MHSVIVTIHVAAMILSMGLMTGAVAAGLFGKISAARIATVGFGVTIVGLASGGILLFDSILSLQCAMLTLYLVGVTALYRYGFAFGDATRARLIRQADNKLV